MRRFASASGYEYSPVHRRELSEMLSDLPSGSPSREQILYSIEGDNIGIIEIADYNTLGLPEPVRADRTPADGEPSNFVKFFRNIGSPRDKEFGGGTYGYGKSSAFALSRCKTFLGYSRSSDRGQSVCRLMVANVSEPFEHLKKRYTGRHWWGVKAQDGTVDPLEKDSAQRASASVWNDGSHQIRAPH